MPKPSIPSFETLVSRPDEGLDVARVALSLATDAYPDLDPGVYLAWLDAAAHAIPDASDRRMPLPERLAMLDHHLFEVERFTGNRDDYFDPRNSFLNDVIERRTGIPITLSVVYLEVGWRLGLPLVPVSFPAHFLVATTGARRVFIDPFNRGTRLASADLVTRLAPMVGGREQARRVLPHAIASVSRREVAMRILRNLAQIYIGRQDDSRTLVVSNRMVALDPNDAPALRERGHVLARLECHQAAWHDYRHYLRLAPFAEDAEDIRARVERLRPLATRLN
ncbi:MAG: tetratricopeptide repeat protein [Thiotrichales bacterium]|nr:tetratricopeptide repeat protein [Thiotrichales bacterium]MCY4286240.1 tetratricopeptide repeat protein [Thiotrichales bacterium]MCY4351084.1 tetratricopeptide repeat protein [Thiotrichales bacterium]